MANNFRNALTQNLAANLVTVYTAPATGLQSSTILGCSIANTSTSPITVDTAIVSGANTTYLVRQATVPVGSSLIVVGAEQKVVLEPADALAVRPSSGSACDVAVSVLEITT